MIIVFPFNTKDSLVAEEAQDTPTGTNDVLGEGVQLGAVKSQDGKGAGFY